MTTRKELLTKMYIDFTKAVNEIISDQLFPSLDDLDITDLVILFTFTFQDKTDYTETIANLLDINHIEIDNATFDKLYPVIKLYINALKDFLKSN